jgi:hypothetical protein
MRTHTITDAAAGWPSLNCASLLSGIGKWNDGGGGYNSHDAGDCGNSHLQSDFGLLTNDFDFVFNLFGLTSKNLMQSLKT